MRRSPTRSQVPVTGVGGCGGTGTPIAESGVDLAESAMGAGGEALQHVDPGLRRTAGLGGPPVGEGLQGPGIGELDLAGPGPAHQDPGDALRVLEGEVAGGAPAHGDARRDHRLDPQRIEQGDDVVDEPVGRLGVGGAAVPAGIGDEDAPLGEGAELRTPHPGVDGAAVQQQERQGVRIRAGQVEIGDALVGEVEVDRGGVRHRSVHDTQGVISRRG